MPYSSHWLFHFILRFVHPATRRKVILCSADAIIVPRGFASVKTGGAVAPSPGLGASVLDCSDRHQDELQPQGGASSRFSMHRSVVSSRPRHSWLRGEQRCVLTPACDPRVLHMTAITFDMFAGTSPEGLIECRKDRASVDDMATPSSSHAGAVSLGGSTETSWQSARTVSYGSMASFGDSPSGAQPERDSGDALPMGLASHVIHGLRDEQLRHSLGVSRWLTMDALQPPDAPIAMAALILILAALFVWQGPTFGIL
jgi:hypothetical protein